jgi:hypothetical protein
MTLTELWGFIQVGGLPAGLFLALVGVFRGWWYPAYMYKDLERDRDEWKAIALQNMSVASAVTDELKERRPRASK